MTGDLDSRRCGSVELPRDVWGKVASFLAPDRLDNLAFALTCRLFRDAQSLGGTPVPGTREGVFDRFETTVGDRPAHFDTTGSPQRSRDWFGWALSVLRSRNEHQARRLALLAANCQRDILTHLA